MNIKKRNIRLVYVLHFSSNWVGTHSIQRHRNILALDTQSSCPFRQIGNNVPHYYNI